MLEGVFGKDQDDHDAVDDGRIRVIRRASRGRWEVRDKVTGRILGSFSGENEAHRRKDLIEPDE